MRIFAGQNDDGMRSTKNERIGLLALVIMLTAIVGYAMWHRGGVATTAKTVVVDTVVATTDTVARDTVPSHRRIKSHKKKGKSRPKAKSQSKERSPLDDVVNQP